MTIRSRRWLGALLSVVLIVAGFALPATAAENPFAPSGEVLIDLAAKAKPSVVGILSTLKTQRSTEKDRSAGTGFVYKQGVIITNAHVVEDALEVKVLYSDKTVETVPASQIFYDRTSDVGIIKVTTPNLIPVKFADSDRVQVGQQVVAIGNPLGFRLGNSVTAGILSGVGRTLGSGYPFLQFDAPINPGNSGGPLFNVQGEVIGINSAKMAELGVEGLSFAIPSNTAIEIAEALLKDGKVERATMGITLDEGWEAQFGVPNAEGVTIWNIIVDGPVGRTGLRPGDKLVQLDSMKISSTDDYFAFMSEHKPGDWVKVTVKRGGQLLSVMVHLVSQDELREVAEGEGAEEVGGILKSLSAGQIQEAAEFGRTIATGWGRINDDYYAISGSNYAILYTEYLYVARRIASAYEFGFQPSVGFQQAVAKEINNKIELRMEIHGDRDDFLKDATYYITQNDRKVGGHVVTPASYTLSKDGKVAIGDISVRFSSTSLTTTDDLTVVVVQQDGKEITFHFTIADLR